MKEFNTTGPCRPDRHYMIPPLERTPGLVERIRSGHYLAINGPRQSGKTSVLRAAVASINADGWARAVLVSCEAAGIDAPQASLADTERRLVGAWHAKLRRTFPEVEWEDPTHRHDIAGTLIENCLADWAMRSDRPLVFIIDEVDTLARDPFVSLLRQIRSGFIESGSQFPHSIVLAGMRHLRDHDIALGGHGNGSPFNIVGFVGVGNFAPDEVARLYEQHAQETGQSFTEEARRLVWDQTRGQPWLVNAIGRICVSELVTDRAVAVAPAHVEQAIRRIEQGQSTHLASLASRLSERRVLNVVAPLVVGDAPDVAPDDLRYAQELGLVVGDPSGMLGPANPIYARALLSAVTSQERTKLTQWAPAWLVDGRLDLDRLRDNFLTFWSIHRNMMKDRITYPEAVAHFGLMTYLDRVANGGGRVDREFAVGRGRLDLMLMHGEVKLPIEVKVHRDHGGDPVPAGLEQLDRYCADLRLERAWLVVFDQRTNATGTRLDCVPVVTERGCRVEVIRA